MARALFGLATKLIKMKNAGTHVPTNVMMAAYKVMQKKDTEADRQTIYNAVNATKTNARQFGRALKSLNAPLDIAGKYAQLGNLMAQGGVTSVVGGMKAVTEGAADVNRIAHEKWFKDAVGSVLGDSLKGERFTNGLGATARYAGMGIGLVAQSAAIVAGIAKTGEALGGLGDMEGRRMAWSQHALAVADPRMNYREKKLAEMRFEHSENRASGFNALPLVGELGARMTDKFGPKEIGELETRVALDRMRIGGKVSAESLRALGRERYFTNTYGAVGGSFAASFNKIGKHFFGPAGDVIAAQIEAGAEKGSTEEGNKALTRAAALKNAGFKFVEEGNFDAARESLKQANREVPGSAPAWSNPEALYPAMLQAAAARRGWPMMDRPRLSRTGE